MDKIKYSEEEENKKLMRKIKKLMSIITKLKNIIKC